MADFVFEKAKRVCAKYGTRDPFELLDRMDAVTVFSRGYEREGLKGYATVLHRTKYAVINERLPETEQRIVAGHEAAHLILHRNEIVSSPIQALRDFDLFNNSGRIEHQANLFLADFLIEDNDVIECVRDQELDFFGTARALYVPAQLLAFKQHSMVRRGYKVRSPIDLDSGFLRGG